MKLVEVMMWFETELTADASTNTRSTTCAFTPKWRYFKTVPGILKTVELILGLLVSALANPIQCTYLSPCSAPLDPIYRGAFAGQAFVIFVGVVFLIGNLIFLIFYVLIWQTKQPKYFPLVELCYVSCAATLYLLAGCVEAWYASMQKISPLPELNPFRPAWIACAVFAWLNFLLYLAETLLFLSQRYHLFKTAIKPEDTTVPTVFQQSIIPAAPAPMTTSSSASTSMVEEPKVYIVDKNGLQLQTLV